MAKKINLAEDAQLAGRVELRVGILEVYTSKEDDMITMCHKAFGDYVNTMNIPLNCAEGLADVLKSIK